MRGILAGMAAMMVMTAWSGPALAVEARAWDVDGTHIAVEDGANGQRLTVSRDGAEAVRLDGQRLFLREPLGGSVTGGAVPQLVATAWSGGTHCCYTLHLIELGERPRLIQSIDAGHSDVDLFAQLDDDPALEIVLPDWSYAYWPGSFANSPVPRVILKWDGQRYAPSVKLMRAGTMLYQMQDRRQPQSDEETIGAVLQDTLDMIYAGRMKAARTLLKQLLPPTPENRRIEQALFDCKLPSSPWWPFVASLNNLPAKPPAEACAK